MKTTGHINYVKVYVERISRASNNYVDALWLGFR